MMKGTKQNRANHYEAITEKQVFWFSSGYTYEGYGQIIKKQIIVHVRWNLRQFKRLKLL